MKSFYCDGIIACRLKPYGNSVSDINPSQQLLIISWSIFLCGGDDDDDVDDDNGGNACGKDPPA